MDYLNKIYIKISTITFMAKPRNLVSLTMAMAMVFRELFLNVLALLNREGNSSSKQEKYAAFVTCDTEYFVTRLCYFPFVTWTSFVLKATSGNLKRYYRESVTRRKLHSRNLLGPVESFRFHGLA